ncbi:MAG: hypothetical protein COA74_12820 [Gammaproteobacteria bacterium]|nr:MAG: hypothetical protein COA74_12820 [Gammaproteobacteria bacterium]
MKGAKKGIKEFYLLTENAEEYFSNYGYKEVSRKEVIFKPWKEICKVPAYFYCNFAKIRLT